MGRTDIAISLSWSMCFCWARSRLSEGSRFSAKRFRRFEASTHIVYPMAIPTHTPTMNVITTPNSYYTNGVHFASGWQSRQAFICLQCCDADPFRDLAAETSARGWALLSVVMMAPEPAEMIKSERGGLSVIKGVHTALVSAPSIMRFVPEIRLASGLARNTTPAATSSAVPIRPVGFKDIAVL